MLLHTLFYIMNRWRYFVLFVVSFLAFSMWAIPVVRFEPTLYDFGVIEEVNGPVSCVFEVYNDGDKPMIIEGIFVACGCTTAEYSQDPIPPGKKGEIYVTFDPNDRERHYSKTIFVYTNTSPRKNHVRIKAEIIPDPNDPW